MAESVIERVARAIQDKLPGWLAEDGTVEDVDLARAAIKAMREPTDAMVDTAWAEIGEHGDADVAVIYANMIDAAINEQVSG